jgi:hypothetical protein
VSTAEEWQIPKLILAPIGGLSVLTQLLFGVTGALFQGQLARENRIRIFVATASMLRTSWKEWSRMNAEIVEPNLRIMFALKNDFVSNRILCLCDLVAVNGYELNDLGIALNGKFKIGQCA